MISINIIKNKKFDIFMIFRFCYLMGFFLWTSQVKQEYEQINLTDKSKRNSLQLDSIGVLIGMILDEIDKI